MVPSARVSWWVTNLLHIETLFVIGIVIAIIYFIWFAKGRKIEIENVDAFFSRTLGPQRKGKTHRPEKKKNKSEERCREIFEGIFGRKFKSVRPKWLENPVTNKNLELDGFCDSIRTKLGKGLAFEYDGEQHAKYNKHFHPGGPMEFIYQTKKDSWKDLRCREEGVMLIRIPHFVAFQDLERYIKTKLRKEGFGSYVDGGGGMAKGGMYD